MMISAVLTALFVILFMGGTMFWGSWYSLNARNKDGVATLMPVILALPRLFLAVASVAIGVYVFKWSTAEMKVFIAILFSLWILLAVSQIMYVQTKLRNRKYARQEVAEVSCQQIQISREATSNSALIAYEARKRAGLC